MFASDSKITKPFYGSLILQSRVDVCYFLVDLFKANGFWEICIDYPVLQRSSPLKKCVLLFR